MNDDLLLQIKTIIETSTDPENLREQLVNFHPYDLAAAFNLLDEDLRQKIYQTLTPEQLADLFEYIESDETADFLEEMGPQKSASVLAEMEADDATDVLQEIQGEQKEAYLSQIEPETKEELTYLTSHPEDTAGAVMTTNYIALERTLDVKQAMKILVKEANESEIIDPLFIIDQDHLVGTVSLKDLIIARSPKMLEEIMTPNPITVDVGDEAKLAVNKINDYALEALPVLDQGKMVGIITIDDAMDVIDDSASEVYSLFAGVGVDTKDTIWSNILKRLPWLVILLILSMVLANAIQLFEDIIKQVTVLIFFQTMILDMAGNAGTQSLAVSLQSLDREELTNRKHKLRHIFKEVRINFFNALILGIFAFGVSYLFLLINGTTGFNILIIALIIGLASAITIIISGMFGSLFPIALKGIGIDPAVASGPFITTVNDVFSTLVYFGLAYLLFSYL
ncbi:MAG TPA: magnesium transporter [Bacilli bacterium]|nr:MAG: Magnesium transporter MgtE [Tenericutes bacterium ADurb.BinA124]HNZ50601.1 magnesium transporter [Bacilli bacterium]HPX84776.1 magnesium transporter [Bacilli bacterium]HQC74950.1 magnesium transporter [Bacilli bacterium]